jgi:uncharacterized protein (DUF1778 family)
MKSEEVMAGKMKESVNQRLRHVSFRATSEQRSLIDRAVKVLGNSRMDFILEAACRRAASLLADRIHSALPGEERRRCTDLLDARAVSNVWLTAQLSTRLNGTIDLGSSVLQQYNYCATRTGVQR